MASRKFGILWVLGALVSVVALPAHAQSFRVQCPTSTITHPSTLHDNNSEPAYTAPTTMAVNTQGFYAPTANINGAIKCQQVSGGDGYSTMADGTQTFMFSFGPLSGLTDIANGQPGTEVPNVFNNVYPGAFQPGDPATAEGDTANSWATWTGSSPIVPLGSFTWNGAVGLAPDADAIADGKCAAPCLDGHVD